MVMDPGDRIRVSDAERETIIAQLHAATAEGRLTLEEFSDRASLAYASRTRGELARLVDDLPVPSGSYVTPVVGPAGPSGTLPLLALIFGLLSLPASMCEPLGAGVGVAGIVLGILGLRAVRRSKAGNRAMAIIGIVCGAVGVAAQAALLVVLATLGVG
jgi:hypothetical protein